MSRWHRHHPEAETVICGTCNGSGEGMWDGSRCGECRGEGEVPADPQAEEDRLAEYAEWRAEQRRDQELCGDDE